MKLRALICLVLVLIVISDITVVTAINATNVTTTKTTNITTVNATNITTVPAIGFITTVPATGFYTINVAMRRGIGAFQSGPFNQLKGFSRINSAWVRTEYVPHCGFLREFSIIHNGHINTLQFVEDRGLTGGPGGRVTYIRYTDFTVYQHGQLVASGSGLGVHILNLPPPPTPINLSHALNFTLAAAMALPTMTVDIVDDIMLTIGKYIKCGIAKFAIRAALLKLAAKGVAVTVAITAVGYLFSEFADDIYNAIFITVPEINPGDTHFHETEIPQVMDVIDTYYPVLPHIRNAIEQDIRAHIDVHGYISIADVMQIIRNHQNNVVIDIYQETPEILPENIVINRYQVPEIMDIIDIYFPVELPIRNIIEQEIYRRIDDDEFNEIPFSEVIDIIEEEQNIFIPEFPVETPEEHQEYIDNIIDRIVHEDPYIPTIPATPCIFQGIPATPIIPRTPERPKEKIHTFPFYSLFVDPMAAVMGITLAHLFAAMMIIGTIISIAASWGSIGAILGGFIGTIMTSYFGLTSWLIPLYLIVVFIIYTNIRIRNGGGRE